MTSEEKAYFDQQFGAINERLDGLDGRFDGVDKRLDGVDQRLDGVDRRFDGVDQRLDGVDKRLDGVETRLSGEIHALGVDLEDKYQNVKLLAEQFPTLQQVTNDKIDDLRTELLDLIVPIGQAVRHHFKTR